MFQSLLLNLKSLTVSPLFLLKYFPRSDISPVTVTAFPRSYLRTLDLFCYPANTTSIVLTVHGNNLARLQ